jgi:hypothetical protein
MKSIKHTLLFLIVVTTISSCKKYPDGPSLSLISRKERISNTWQISAYFENNIDKTTDFKNAFQNAKIVIDKNGNYNISYKAFGLADYTESGTWNFTNNDIDFVTNPSTGTASTATHHILKLKEKELWYKEDPDGSSVVREYHLIP